MCRISLAWFGCHEAGIAWLSKRQTPLITIGSLHNFMHIRQHNEHYAGTCKSVAILLKLGFMLHGDVEKSPEAVQRSNKGIAVNRSSQIYCYAFVSSCGNVEDTSIGYGIWCPRKIVCIFDCVNTCARLDNIAEHVWDRVLEEAALLKSFVLWMLRK